MENKIIKSDYVASAVRSSQYPEEILPEIVFIGRSNVGKSSLINSLCNRKNLARTSQTPGKTQTINFYKATLKITNSPSTLPSSLLPFYLVDLPGYGYAKTSKTNRTVWAKFIDEYLTKSRQIKFICQLVDIRHAPQDSDLAMFQNILEKNLPVLIVATKSDKLSKSERAKNLAVIKKTFNIEELPILPYSSKNGEGHSDLLDVIADSL
jgi:GTP-binding protein